MNYLNGIYNLFIFQNCVVTLYFVILCSCKIFMTFREHYKSYFASGKNRDWSI